MRPFPLFERGSGGKLNQSKSKGLWLGSWRGRQDPPIALEWTSDKLKVLGVFIGHGDLEGANWRPRLDAVANVLSSWHQCSLSCGRRAVVMNALALARFWYVASLIHVPDWVYADLKQACFEIFLWRQTRSCRLSCGHSALYGWWFWCG